MGCSVFKNWDIGITALLFLLIGFTQRKVNILLSSQQEAVL